LFYILRHVKLMFNILDIPYKEFKDQIIQCMANAMIWKTIPIGINMLYQITCFLVEFEIINIFIWWDLLLNKWNDYLKTWLAQLNDFLVWQKNTNIPSCNTIDVLPSKLTITTP
jgi:hypothetical protein